MGTSESFSIYIKDQLSLIEDIQIKKMFGEYGIFLNQKMVGLICDDQLFIKPTEEGLKLLKDPVYAPPYKGAKPYFLIEDTDDRSFIKELILMTEKVLPLPKIKKKKV